MIKLVIKFKAVKNVSKSKLAVLPKVLTSKVFVNIDGYVSLFTRKTKQQTNASELI